MKAIKECCHLQFQSVLADCPLVDLTCFRDEERAVVAPAEDQVGPERNLVMETLMTMDLPRINFVRSRAQIKENGLDRMDFVIAMGT